MNSGDAVSNVAKGMLRTRARNEILAEVVGLIWKLISDDGVRQLPNM